MSIRVPLRIAAVVALAVGASTVCLAQPAAPAPRFAVTTTHLKPDMVSEWRDLQKNEVIPAYKKAGYKERTITQTIFGNGYEYVTITPLDKYATRDGAGTLVRALGAEAAARLVAKLSKCVVSSHTYVSTRIPELSNAMDGPTPAITISTRYRVAAGKGQEWENFVKAEILPVYKKAKAGYSVSRRGFGGNLNDRTTTTFAATFAELDAGSVFNRTLGADAAAKVRAKGVGLSNVIETVVRRRVEDLSF